MITIRYTILLMIRFVVIIQFNSILYYSVHLGMTSVCLLMFMIRMIVSGVIVITNEFDSTFGNSVRLLMTNCVPIKVYDTPDNDRHL